MGTVEMKFKIHQSLAGTPTFHLIFRTCMYGYVKYSFFGTGETLVVRRIMGDASTYHVFYQGITERCLATHEC